MTNHEGRSLAFWAILLEIPLNLRVDSLRANHGADTDQPKQCQRTHKSRCRQQATVNGMKRSRCHLVSQQRAPRHACSNLRVSQRKLNRSARETRVLTRDALGTRSLPILDRLNKCSVMILSNL